MGLSIIVAIDQENGIGKNNQLLCRLSDDLKNFKRITSGHTIVMGRKTFESLPKGPLPKRTNVIISRQHLNIENTIVINDPEQIIRMAEDSRTQIFIIGGAQIYRYFFPYIEEMHLSRIHHRFNADTFFPEINFDKWRVIEEKHFDASEKNDFPFTYYHLIRR